jgi:hypothetical protein
MQPTNRVRTYLDPDAVGPLPRSSLADDSDQLSAARTILRVPGASTVEISADDVIEVVDPNRRSTSVAPVGYDTAIILPRRKLAPYVVAAVAACLVVLVIAAIQSVPRAQGVTAHTPPETTAPARPPEPKPVVAPVPQPAAPQPAPASTIGTLLVDSTAEGQRVFVDGVILSAHAALLRCGPHDVAMGSPGRTRTIDVPCGGEVTVYR